MCTYCILGYFKTHKNDQIINNRLKETEQNDKNNNYNLMFRPQKKNLHEVSKDYNMVKPSMHLYA